jgi:hypothetical protein
MYFPLIPTSWLPVDPDSNSALTPHLQVLLGQVHVPQALEAMHGSLTEDMFFS